MFKACWILQALSLLSVCETLKLDSRKTNHAVLQPQLATDATLPGGELTKTNSSLRSSMSEMGPTVDRAGIASFLAVIALVQNRIPSVAIVKSSLVLGIGPVIALAFLMVFLGSRLRLSIASAVSAFGCILGLCASWIGHGFLQEAILTKPYGTELFPSAAFLVLGGRIGMLFCGLITVKVVQQQPLVPSEMDKHQGGGIAQAMTTSLLPALVGVAASWIQFGSLLFVTFPTMTLFKSAKVVPSMLAGVLMQRKAYPMSECVEVLIIAAGLVIFTWFSETNPEAGKFIPSLIGIAMVVACLLFDALAPAVQQRAFISSGMNAFQIMFWTSLSSVGFCSGMVLAGGEGTAILEFFKAHTDALVDVVAMSVLVVTGSVFIYLLSVKHGSELLAGVTTARQAASTTLSSVVFAHHLPPAAIAAAGVVFTFLILRANRGQRAPGPEAQEIPKATAPSLRSASTTASGIEDDDDAHSDARTEISN